MRAHTFDGDIDGLTRVVPVIRLQLLERERVVLRRRKISVLWRHHALGFVLRLLFCLVLWINSSWPARRWLGQVVDDNVDDGESEEGEERDLGVAEGGHGLPSQQRVM